MTIALILAGVAICFACWLLYTLATLALPMFAAVSIGLWAHGQGSGVLGAVVAGMIVGVATLLAGQFLFAVVRSPLSRLAIGLLFAVPAGFAGYHAVHGIAGIGIESEPWRAALGVIGAVFIGGSAWLRVAGGGEVVRRIEENAASIG